MLPVLLLVAQTALPGTIRMAPMEDPARAMVDGLHAYLEDRHTAAAAARRSAPIPSRTDLRKALGIPEVNRPEKLAAQVLGGRFRIPVERGFDASGQVYGPDAAANCYAVHLGRSRPFAPPDCLSFHVDLLDRGTEYSTNPRLGKVTGQTHREFIYRMGFPAGQHPLGLDIRKVMAVVDYVKTLPAKPVHLVASPDEDLMLVGLLACAIDERIENCRLAGALPSLDRLDPHPVDHNIWRFSQSFDLEVLRKMIAAPRVLTILSRPPLPAGTPPMAEAVFRQYVEYVQRQVRESTWRRAQWFNARSIDTAREEFAADLVGRFPDPLEAFAGRVEARPRYDEPKFTGYEIKIPVARQVFAYGHLLVPKDLKPGERRALVVAQHGLEGRPEDTILKETKRIVYDQFAARMAEQGFIVYAPQNPYIHGDHFRMVQKKANPLGLTLYSFIVAQHRQTLNWLETLPFVDRERIGYYGLSYGGRTAMMVGPLEPRYKVVICSGNFNEWVWKTTSVEDSFSYVFTKEWEMPDWNLGARFNHAEMAMMIAPRPFMVERGHDDGVGIDEWVAYEFARVARYYVKQGIGDKAAIAYFDGNHRIDGAAAYAFLRKHLRHP